MLFSSRTRARPGQPTIYRRFSTPTRTRDCGTDVARTRAVRRPIRHVAGHEAQPASSLTASLAGASSVSKMRRRYVCICLMEAWSRPFSCATWCCRPCQRRIWPLQTFSGIWSSKPCSSKPLTFPGACVMMLPAAIRTDVLLTGGPMARKGGEKRHGPALTGPYRRRWRHHHDQPGTVTRRGWPLLS